MSAPSIEPAIAHLDFIVPCRLVYDGIPCDQEAEYFVVFHKVTHCQDMDCDEHGNICGTVCSDHLAGLEVTADETVRRLRPRRWFPDPHRNGRCPSCNRPLQLPSDVLQLVIAL